MKGKQVTKKTTQQTNTTTNIRQKKCNEKKGFSFPIFGLFIFSFVCETRVCGCEEGGRRRRKKKAQRDEKKGKTRQAEGRKNREIFLKKIRNKKTTRHNKKTTT